MPVRRRRRLRTFKTLRERALGSADVYLRALAYRTVEHELAKPSGRLYPHGIGYDNFGVYVNVSDEVIRVLTPIGIYHWPPGAHLEPPHA